MNETWLNVRIFTAPLQEELLDCGRCHDTDSRAAIRHDCTVLSAAIAALAVHLDGARVRLPGAM